METWIWGRTWCLNLGPRGVARDRIEGSRVGPGEDTLTLARALGGSWDWGWGRAWIMTLDPWTRPRRDSLVWKESPGQNVDSVGAESGCRPTVSPRDWEWESGQGQGLGT